ncbi:MAG: NfeD family protein [Bdellovibrio sp.]|nr:NfeD family protein [Bdellovibrio sp.]
MENFMFYFWWFFAAILMLAEFLLPGLIVIFVGLGAATVAGLMHYHVIDSLVHQLLVWFGSSLFYCFTLRFLVLRFYKSDTEKKSTDEDQFIIGQIASVTESIPQNGIGRIYHADTTWQARSKDGSAIEKNERVKLVGRDNITWIVQKI